MITFAFTFGPRITVQSAHLRRALMSREYLVFYLLSCLILALLNPLEATRQQSLPTQAVIWLGAGGLFHLALLGNSWLLARAGPFSRLGYTPISYLFAMSCSELFNYWFHFMFLGVTADAYPGIAQRVLQQIPIIVAIEQIFVRFLAPVLIDSPELRRLLPRFRELLPEAPAERPAAAPSSSSASLLPSTEIGGQMFVPSEIRLMIAQEHYTKIITESSAQMVRCKISTAAARLPEEFGIRIHRSYWIAWFHAREVMKDAPGRFSVITADGQRIPLSREMQRTFSEQLAARTRPAGHRKPPPATMPAEAG